MRVESAMEKGYPMKSLRELFRIGIGPSSSHTMGPRLAAETFQGRAPDAAAYQVTLYGSLAATGRGHFTDRAILDVLRPEKTALVWKPETVLPFHPNGMKFEAFDGGRNLLCEWTVFSVGGGALRCEGDNIDTPEVYPFRCFSELVKRSEKSGQPLWNAVNEHEDASIWEYLSGIHSQMARTIHRGLEREDVLPGSLHLARRAASVYAKAGSQKEQRTGLIAAYALAVSEENASCGIVATAPTCGSCGILPAVLRYLRESRGFTDRQILCALATAGLVGLTAKQNASISGAEVGCQGEIGVACAMAAGAAAQLLGGTSAQIEYAAEIGLEHFLGLTCDPVMGLVQIPCIERNVLAANQALTAAEYALLTDGRHRVSLDTVIRAMKQTGHDLPALYRETSAGGLAKVVTK